LDFAQTFGTVRNINLLIFIRLPKSFKLWYNTTRTPNAFSQETLGLPGGGFCVCYSDDIPQSKATVANQLIW